jgi:iron complex transport system ATP-binding protein
MALDHPSPPVYDIRNLGVSLGGRPVLGPLDLQIPPGAFLGVLGPNGSGKTTLLRALAGVARPTTGEISFWNRPIREYRPADVARLVGVVPQQFSLEFGFTVAEMVAMGRYAHGGRHAPARHGGRDGSGGHADSDAHSSADERAVVDAMAQTGVSELADRLVTELSGGERQRALIAQTLAQESPVLLLDEPLNNLDLNHQLEIMQLLGRLHKAGRTIIVVLHDLNVAAQYCEHLLLLNHGRVAAEGSATEILDPRVILEVFKVRVAVHRQGLRPYITPVWSRGHETTLEGESARIHIIAGGGAASELMEELVTHGFTPSIGVVSVFDTDYVTAERYELEVVSAPPFQAFPAEAVEQMEALVRDSDVLVVAPVFFGSGNMELLRVARRTVGRGRPVIFLDPDSIERRDLTRTEAVALVKESLAEGAYSVSSVREAVELIPKLDVRPSR